jgi:hypothetical protein
MLKEKAENVGDESEWLGIVSEGDLYLNLLQNKLV